MIAIGEEAHNGGGARGFVKPQGAAFSPGYLQHFQPHREQCQHHERARAPDAEFGVQGEDSAEHRRGRRQSQNRIPCLVGCQADRKPRRTDTRGFVGVDNRLAAVQMRPDGGWQGRQLRQRQRQDGDHYQKRPLSPFE